MPRVMWIVLAAAAIGLPAAPAFADYNAAAVDNLAAKVKAGMGFTEFGIVQDGSQLQTVLFQLRQSVNAGYFIDIKAHLCFFEFASNVTQVSCQAIKKGYPLFAPLITWNKDGWAE
jgi:hypothetical protein